MPPPPAGYYKAVLVPEPTNQHDPNAIRVLLWAGRTWALAGYLSRTDAAAYQSVFRWLAAHGTSSAPAVVCDAAIKSERGGAGVVLHLGTPGECLVELVTDELQRPSHEWVGKRVAFTGEAANTIAGAAIDRPAQLMLARWAGCDVLPRVTKKTELLVVADARTPTASLQNAKDYGVPIVDEPTFLAAIGVPRDLIGRGSTRWAGGLSARR
jgi:NAD-dependent DNA ligase